MNYYRRYVGSYLKKTGSLTMIEDGAYTRLLDSYYATEKPLNPAKIHTISRAQSASEKKAVAHVIEVYFYLGSDGLLHNEKADEELGIAIPKLEKLRAVAHENGKKGGRPKGSGGKTKTGSGKEPDPVLEQKPDPVPKNNPDESNRAHLKQPSTVSHQPDSKPTPKQRIPGDGHSSDSAATLGAAALAGLKAKPMTLDQAKIEGGEDTPAATLAAVLFANGIKGNAFHPLVVEWARDGVTVEQLKDAIARARQRPGKDKPGSFGCEYLDPILNDPTKPAAQVHAEKATKAAAHSVEKANTAIEAGRAAAAAAAPMPEAIKRFPRTASEA